MTYPVDRLLACLTEIELSNPSTGGVHEGYRRNQKPVEEAFDWVLEDFAPVRNVWLSHIEPGGYIKPHRDAGPYYERWQVPIQTAGRMIVDGREIDQQPGVPFQVFHWLPHEVVNDSTRPRIHLVLDRDRIAFAGVFAFEVLEEYAQSQLAPRTPDSG